MDDTRTQSLLDRVLERVRDLGATQADAMIQTSDSTSLRVRSNEVEAVERSASSGLGLRVMINGKHAAASTNNLDPNQLDDFAERLFALARVSAEDPYVGLPDESVLSAAAVTVPLRDESIDNISPEDLEDMARRAESSAFEMDPRIKNSEGAEAYIARGSVWYGNSRGDRRGHTGSRIGLVCSVIGHDEGGAMERDAWWASRRFVSDLPKPEEIGRRAAQRTVRRLGAVIPGTRKSAVVLSPEAAGTVLRHLAQALNGYSIVRKSSFLCDQIGAPIASSLVTLTDDPHIPRAPGSRSFDGEGVATRRLHMIHEGKLERYLLDSYTARKLGSGSPGQAVRSLGSAPRAGSFNLHIANGASSVEDLLAGAGDGVYVTQFMGMGVNLINGDFSKGASGFEIKNGALGAPLKEFTVAGNLKEMMSGIIAVADDLDIYRGISSPSLLINEMTVAGSGEA